MSDGSYLEIPDNARVGVGSPGWEMKARDELGAKMRLAEGNHYGVDHDQVRSHGNLKTWENNK